MACGKPIVRVLATDWGRVVVDFDNGRTASALHPHCAHPMSARALHDLLFHKDGSFAAYSRGELTTPAFRGAWRALLGGAPHCTDEEFDRAFSDVFTANPAVVSRWKALRARGVRIVAASNVEEIRHRRLTAMGVHGLCNAHCLSYQVGAAKPEEAFFTHVVQIAGCAPEEIVFVDDVPAFGEAAGRIGIRYVPYDLRIDRPEELDARLSAFDFVPWKEGVRGED